jgi:hypothetical protein
MSAQNAMSLMSVAEFALWVVLGFLFWTKKLHHRFPAMGGYMAMHVGSAPLLLFLIYGQSRHWFNNLCYPIYFYLYYAVFVASAVLLFFVCMEVFRSTLSAFPGLMKLGIVSFRWAVLASVIVSFSTITFSHRGIPLIPGVAFGLMRSVSIVELCLLSFLCLGMNALRLSVRNIAFGIALGMGMMSTNDLVQSMVISNYTSLTAPWQFVYESLILATLGMWVAYCALPEPARQPLLVPANSTILRWNEIATALGHTGTKVAVQPAGGFRLTEAESAVEEALTQNLNSRASAT